MNTALSDLGHLGDLQIFCRVAETGRFALAAEALRLPPSSVSRAVLRLEARLGLALMTRTTRRLALTDDGAFLFQQVSEALRQIADAEITVAQANARATGRLKIAVPTTYGPLRVLPALPAFEAAHPGLTLEVHVTNRDIDMIEEGFDIMIRLGSQRASSLLSRVLEHGRLGTYAAPAYLAKAPPLADLHDLDAHRCIRFLYPGNPHPLEWEFLVGGVHQTRAPVASALIASDPMGMVAMALAGGGVIQTGAYVVATEVADGRLVEVLQPFAGVTRPVIALYPPNRRGSARVRAFLAHLARPQPGTPA